MNIDKEHLKRIAERQFSVEIIDISESNEQELALIEAKARPYQLANFVINLERLEFIRIESIMDSLELGQTSLIQIRQIKEYNSLSMRYE